MMDARSTTFAFLAALCCACLATAASQGQSNDGKITLDVFYESLCPDSIFFITKQLAPNYNHFKRSLKVNLHPFGKSSWTVNGENGRTSFECQHGAAECDGNRAQACALHVIDQIVPAEEQQDKKLAVVNCTMSNSTPNIAVPECAALHGLNAESVESIKKCSETEFGDKLLVAIGERTNSYQKPLKFVPSILVNGEKQTEAFRNFNQVICGTLAAGNRPGVCSQASSGGN